MLSHLIENLGTLIETKDKMVDIEDKFLNFVFMHYLKF